MRRFRTGPVPDPRSPAAPEPGGDLLAALLDGMDAALCAFDADGVVTHWNREAERILGWPRRRGRRAAGVRGLGGAAPPTPTRCRGG